MRSLLVLCALATTCGKAGSRPGPAAHYVIRTSDLKETLNFTSQVLGLSVLRHEENPEACPITCNGDYAVPWSKTMVGTKPENEAYALEITYNYGVNGYKPGIGLSRFDLFVEDVATAIANAKKLGYAVHGSSVMGPDGYLYAMLKRPENRSEVFASVSFTVADPLLTSKWYAETFGMEIETLSFGAARAYFPTDKSQGVVFNFLVGGPVVATPHDGRNAFSLPAVDVRRIYNMLAAATPKRVVHELQEINEETGLGVLLIAIVTDINGLEICLVSSEAFEAAIESAYTGVGPDYVARAKLAREYASTVAKAKAKKPTVFGWAEL